jgi:hypothetical protein
MTELPKLIIPMTLSVSEIVGRNKIKFERGMASIGVPLEPQHHSLQDFSSETFHPLSSHLPKARHVWIEDADNLPMAHHRTSYLLRGAVSFEKGTMLVYKMDERSLSRTCETNTIGFSRSNRRSRHKMVNEAYCRGCFIG